MKALPVLLGLFLSVHFQAAFAADPAAPAKLPADLVAVADAAYVPLDKLAEGSKAAQEAQKAAGAKLGLPLEVKSAKTGIAFRLIPAGTFTMGSPADDAEEDKDEEAHPHRVMLSKAFYCGKCPVTQGQWTAVMGNNPSHFKDAGKDAPVENVSWDDCQEFLKRLCTVEGVPVGTYRLLSEAEWEYACRAGTTGGTYGDLGIIAWYDGDSDSTTRPVGLKLPNAFGLYDMLGNVCQWCADWHGNYPAGAVTDPTGAATGRVRVLRGGGWDDDASDCRAASRKKMVPGEGARYDFLGLRILRLFPGQ